MHQGFLFNHMKSKKSTKKLLILVYFLVAYIFIQFFWWAWLLVELNKEIFLLIPEQSESDLRSKIFMIIGEGAVFLIFLLLGLFFMQRSVKKEIGLAKQQRNFLLSITHELKTPISSIKLYLQTLLKHRHLDELKREQIYLSSIEDIERLNRLVENILIATRIENSSYPLDKEQINITELTAQIISSLENTSGINHKTVLHLEKDVFLTTDKSAFHSILGNLYENAAKYSPNGSTIEIAVEDSNTEVALYIRDEGPGISENEVNNIFLKFYRIGNEETRKNKGTGLGLFIVKEMAGLLKGKISVRNKRSRGSEFKVILPK